MIRPAELRDVDAIRAVAEAAWTDAYAGIIPVDVQRQALDAWYARDSIAQSIERGDTTFLVAERHDVVIGFIQVAGDVLARIYVMPREQRSGAGTRMLDAIGARNLIVTVERDNAKGRGFYERNGFRVVGESLQKIGNARYRS